MMRTIQIEFDVPKDIEDDYADVDASLVVEDLLKPEVGFVVIKDETT